MNNYGWLKDKSDIQLESMFFQLIYNDESDLEGTEFNNLDINDIELLVEVSNILSERYKNLMPIFDEDKILTAIKKTCDKQCDIDSK